MAQRLATQPDPEQAAEDPKAIYREILEKARRCDEKG